jgi:putative membrane protein insertion efficiency factor
MTCSCGDCAPPRTGAETGPAARAVIVALKVYKTLLSPLFAGSCRYLPSCSDYMAEAVERHGAAAGAALGLRRLASCHPLGGSGLDPVPEHRPWRALVSRRRHAEPGARA